MAVQTIEITPISNIPDDYERGTSGLGRPDSKTGNSLHHAQRTLTDKRVTQKPFHCGDTNTKMEKQQTYHGNKDHGRQQAALTENVPITYQRVKDREHPFPPAFCTLTRQETRNSFPDRIKDVIFQNYLLSSPCTSSVIILPPFYGELLVHRRHD